MGAIGARGGRRCAGIRPGGGRGRPEGVPRRGLRPRPGRDARRRHVRRRHRLLAPLGFAAQPAGRRTSRGVHRGDAAALSRLHNWMLALFCERAQDEVFADGRVLCPAPLAPTGRGTPVDGGIRLTGRWSWATGVMDADWILVGAMCGPDDAPYPALVLLPSADIRVEDGWHTAGMCATGSHDRGGDGVWG